MISKIFFTKEIIIYIVIQEFKYYEYLMKETIMIT